MKRGTIDHPKTLDLGDRLGVPVYVAVGVLECLWHWTAQYAPAGDAGRWSDVAIVRGIGWDAGDASRLIDALVQSQWLDAHDEHRLIVHGWSEHCEDTVHRQLARSGDLFADGTAPKLTRLSGDERARAERLQKEAIDNHTKDIRGSAHVGRTPCALPRPRPKPRPLPKPRPGCNQAETEDPGRSRARVASVGEVLGGSAFGEFASRSDLAARIRKVAHDGPEWSRWFEAAVVAFDAAGLLGEVEAVVRYAEDCASPAIRQAKDLGELKRPGAFICGKLLSAARAAKVRLPNCPKPREAVR